MFNNLMSQFTSMLITYQEWLKFLGEALFPIIIILCFVTLMLIEINLASGKQSRAELIQSYRTNIATFIFNNVVLSVVSISSVLILAESYHHYGLLSDYSQPMQFLFSFVLFDLLLYLWHRANHAFDFLWMFHKVHHCDKSMNSSTTFRVHFIEVALSTLLKAIFILVAGVEISIIVMCEGLVTLFIMFHHLNIQIRGENWLKYLFIVPSLHRIHHSPMRKEHDSNYGAVFSLWDRMFRTLTESRQNEVGLINVKALNFYQLLGFGFLSDVPSSVQSSSETLKPENINSMIAEAAYYIAEKRNFISGFESLDWLEARQQINKI